MKLDDVELELVPTSFGSLVISPADRIMGLSQSYLPPLSQIRLAYRALVTDRNCVEAHLTLAKFAPNSDAARLHYGNACRAGFRLWSAVRDTTGEDIAWWDNGSTRPYMRAVFETGKFVASDIDHKTARTCFELLLDLDPRDRIGAQSELEELNDTLSVRAP